jgi:hypothetical protein
MAVAGGEAERDHDRRELIEEDVAAESHEN